MKTITFAIIVILLIGTSDAQRAQNITGCLTYNTTVNTTCLNCNIGYFLATGNTSCLSAATYGCNTIGNYANFTGCTVCASGSGLSVNLYSTTYTGCQACSTTNCGNCLANYASCTACSAGYFFYATNVCQLSSAWDCAASADNVGCTACATGFGLNNQYNLSTTTAGFYFTGCSACNVNNCTSCYSNYTFCSSWATSFILQNTTSCFNSSLLNCNTSANFRGCITCIVGTGLAINGSDLINLTTCAAGDSNCNYCGNNNANCTTCVSPFLTQFTLNNTLI